MCSTGSPEAFWMRSIRSRRSQPECVAGWVERMISSGRCSATASMRRQERVGVADFAGRLDALGGDRGEGEVDAHLRGFAHRLVVDHKAGRGLALRHDEAEAHVAAGRALAHRLEQLRAAERAVGDHQDSPSSGVPPPHHLVPASCSSARTPLSQPRPAWGRAHRRCRAPRRGRRTRMGRRRRSGRGRS